MKNCPFRPFGESLKKLSLYRYTDTKCLTAVEKFGLAKSLGYAQQFQMSLIEADNDAKL